MKTINQLKLLTTLLFILTIGQNGFSQQTGVQVKGVGVVVKRNPGGVAFTASPQGENGQVSFTITEQGNYVITATQQPENSAKVEGGPVTGVRMNMGHKTNGAKTEVHGGPVQGIKMGLGKNPSGAMVGTQTTNDKGEVEFKNLEPGNYTLSVNTSESGCPKGFELRNGICEPIASTTKSTDYVGHVTLLKRTACMIYIGGGLSMPSSSAKDNAFVSKSTAISLDACIPVSKRGWGPNGNWFGINIGGTYNFGGSGGSLGNYAPLSIDGKTSGVVSDKGTDPRNPGFRMGVGPQANFNMGKFIVSPILMAEYMSVTRKEMSSVQTIQYNGQTYDFNLASAPETKASGFAITPKVRLQYMITENFGLFADASYTMGPKMESSTSIFVPNGKPNPQTGSYNIDQIQSATMVKGETKSTSVNSVGINFGVVIKLFGNEQSRPRHTCLICGRKHRGICKNGYDDSKVKSENKNANLCTVCGKEAWGDLDHPNCKGKTNTDDINKGWNGKTAEELMTGLTKQSGSGSKKYYNDTKNDCSATSGIECTDDISVSDDFDLVGFDKFVSTNDPERIKNIFIKNDMEKFLGDFMKLPNSKEIISGLKSGDLTIKKLNTNVYQLGTPAGISRLTNTVKVQLSKKHDYVGHVTLLR